MADENGRMTLLSEYGRFYGQERLAVAFTAGVEGDAAKRVLTKGWDKTAPLADGDFGAAYVAGRGATKNPVVVLRPSNLIVLECDSEEDLVRIQELGLPETITVRSSEAYKRHFWFRPPKGLEALPFVAFRFESGKLTADSGRYFLVPPAVHPSGAVYTFLNGPDEYEIVELPEETYRTLSEHARASDDDLREALEIDPEMKIKAGKRREMIFRYACMLRRWGLPETDIVEAAQRFNLNRCHPPVDYHLVQVQVDGAMKMRGDQELADVLQAQDDAPFTMQVVSASALCDEPDIDTGQLLGPLVLSAGRTIVVGDTGEGKTTISLQIVRAILNGDDFVGWVGAGTGRALIIDLEQGRRSVKRSLRDAQLDGRDDVDLVLVPDGLSLDRETAHYDELDRVIAEGGYTIVVLDPYYKAHRADEPNAERPIVDLMRMLDRLRTDYGFALILPAHPRKEMAGSSGPRKLTIHDVSGSSAVTRGAEVVIGIEKVAHGLARLRFLKDREGDLEVGESWNLLFEKGEGFKRDPKDFEPPRDYEEEVRDASQDGQWRTIKEYKILLKAGETALRPALVALEQEGFLEYQVGPEGRNRTAKCWRKKVSQTPWGHPRHQGSLLGQEEVVSPVPPPVLGGTEEDTTPTPADEVPPLDEGTYYYDDDGIPF